MMLSSYCRPSSRPHKAFDPETSSSEQSNKVSVSFAEPDHESPRSCANPLIFLDLTKNDDDADREADTQKKLSNIGNGNEFSASEDVVQEETPAEVAMLLASVADIANKEIKADPPIMSALADAFPRFPDLSSSLSDESENGTGGNIDHHPPHPNFAGVNNMNAQDMDVDEQQPKEDAAIPALMHFDHKKARAISVDFSELRAVQEPLALAPPPHEAEAIPTLLQWRNLRGQSTSPPHHHGIFSTPPPSPLVSSRNRHYSRAMHHSDFGRSNSLTLSASKGQQTRGRPRSVSLAEGAMAIQQVPVLDLNALVGGVTKVDNKPKKLILRKKFSWKNYPELEEFLIANREEYLRHSTLNYTMQQKKYNNCLTERMIKLAGEHGYMFDETEFSFVTVRDRIRCYYKSYVQSMKKRGVVIGYAARKAGLVTEEELEQSAHTSGKIYVPRN